MVRCNPAGGNVVKESRKRSWTPSRRSWLQMAALVSFAGVLSAAGTVAASRAPDPQGAYGPPQPPASTHSTEIEPSVTRDVTPVVVAEVPATTAVSGPAVATVEPATEFAAALAAVATPVAEPVADTTTSSTSASPTVIASSWSMSPLPEGEGGVVSSGTEQSPETVVSSLVAAPR